MKRGRRKFASAVHPQSLINERSLCVITQKQAADLVGVSTGTWSNWERGLSGMSVAYYGIWLERSIPLRQFWQDPSGRWLPNRVKDCPVLPEEDPLWHDRRAIAEEVALTFDPAGSGPLLPDGPGEVGPLVLPDAAVLEADVIDR